MPDEKTIRGFFWQILMATGGVAAFIFWILSITANGFFNFFSDQPAVQLFPFALVVCVALFVLVHKFVGGYSKNKALYFGVGVICMVVLAITSLCVHIRTSQNRQREAERRQDQTNLAEIPKGFSDMKEELKNLAVLLKSNGTSTNQSDYVVFPGIGFHAVLRLNGVIPNRPNYILDWGESAISNRMSLFILPDQSLRLRIIDPNGDSYSVMVKPRFDTFTFHSLMFIVCEFGNAGDESFLRIIINGRVVAYQQYPELGNFNPDPLKMRQGEIGADIDRKNGSAMTIEYYETAKGTFDRKMRDEIMNAIADLLSRIKPNEGGWTFNGNGSMEFGDGGPVVHPRGDAEFQPRLFNPTN